MITLYQYSFNVGYPKPYINICAYCEEEAIDKLKTLHPEVKWFELSSIHPKVIRRIETENDKPKEETKHIPTPDEYYDSWAKGVLENMKFREESMKMKIQTESWTRLFDSF